jgi:hypothetical protein
MIQILDIAIFRVYLANSGMKTGYYFIMLNLCRVKMFPLSLSRVPAPPALLWYVGPH